MKEAREGVVVLRDNGIELVVVAAGARESRRQERACEHVDLVGDAVGLILADVHW